jgi:hypothetical protein
VSGRIRSGDVSMLQWEQRDGVHWACLGVGSNGDLVWLGLASLTLAVARVSPGHSRHRVAGIGRGARGLALQEIRWDAFWPLVAFFLWRRGCLVGECPLGDSSLGRSESSCGGEDVQWGECLEGDSFLGRSEPSGGRQWTHCRGSWSFGKNVQGGECPSGDSSGEISLEKASGLTF